MTPRLHFIDKLTLKQNACTWETSLILFIICRVIDSEVTLYIILTCFPKTNDLFYVLGGVSVRRSSVNPLQPLSPELSCCLVLPSRWARDQRSQGADAQLHQSLPQARLKAACLPVPLAFSDSSHFSTQSLNVFPCHFEPLSRVTYMPLFGKCCNGLL